MIPRTIALQAPLSKGFPSKQYWNGLPFPPPGDFPYPSRLNLHLLVVRWILFHWATWESPLYFNIFCQILNLPVVVSFRHDSQCSPAPGIHALMTLLPMCDWAYWLAYDKKIFGKGDLSNIWQRLLPRLVFKSVCVSFCLDFFYLFLCSTWEETWKLSGDSPEEAEFCQWPFKCPFLLLSKEIKPVNPKGNQLWIFIGRNDAEAEVPILWLPDVKIQLIEKDHVAGKDWRQEKGLTEVEMVGWRH